MKIVAICAKGLEDVTQKEIKEILKVESKVTYPGRIVFETEEVEKLKSQTQSIIKLYEFKQHTQSHKDVKPFKLKSPFRVICSKSRETKYEYSSQVIEKEIGEIFFKEGNKVDLKNPETIVFVDVLADHMIIGIDLTPKLLSKREYRIKIHNQSINACIAYGLVRLSGYDKTKTLLDPFAKDGVIAIEAAKFAKGKIFAFESLFPNVKNVEINAKLAGVRKEIKVSRIEVEWLGTKFKDKEVDCVVSVVPYPSKNVKENFVKKVYKELFHHLDYILNDKGRIVLIAPTLDLLKQMNEKFEIVEERTVSTSNLAYSAVVYKRKD